MLKEAAAVSPTRPASQVLSVVRILGIDPGLRVTGFGILEKSGQKLAYVTSGCIRTDQDADLPERIRTILEGLSQLIAEMRPHQVAVEKVFVNVNPQSTLLLGQARGAAICAAVIGSLPVSEYTALQVKQAVVGNGHARKEQVQEMVRRLLKLPGDPSPDAADALACAICHAHGGQGLGKLATSGYRMKRGRLV
ncbi:MAG TPA: crossover junction endodeoxyribonuclease RuvC [Burkholderiales bacterium]|jgi:crossover junction endodeoxyribonuclease RuvC|nr:crossover junction endodeoxyribonuclease RuvC [Burkholderiales bacterium]